jgi:hypothetical protein
VDAVIMPVTGRPDLAVVDLRVDYNVSAGSIEDASRIVATIKNLGPSDYRSDEGSQIFVLYKNGDLVAQRRFADLAVGAELSLAVEDQQGAAVYEARVVYAEEIQRDGNPRNDDVNPRNDSLLRSLNPA